MTPIEFTKMQGLGNDFVVIEGPRDLSPEEVAEICDRRFGVGADGVLVVTADDSIRMQYWNADGSVAEMCGNGLRCVARYVYDRGWVESPGFVIDTAVGHRRVAVSDSEVEVELGHATVGDIRTLQGGEYQMVDIGNPHAVAFVEDLSTVNVTTVGQALQTEFPEGINVEFARFNGAAIEMRVWERGVGETLACGTGIAAVAAVAHEKHGVAVPVAVVAPGGTASVDLRQGVAWLRGPAEYSFRGSVESR